MTTEFLAENVVAPELAASGMALGQPTPLYTGLRGAQEHMDASLGCSEANRQQAYRRCYGILTYGR